MSNNSQDSVFGEPISTYTRKEAIEDGTLVDLMQPGTVALVREAGFKFDIAMTATAFSAAVAPIDGELPPGQDLNGRLWDVLNLLRFAIKRAKGPANVVDGIEVRVWNGKRHDIVRLWSLCGAGDNGEPVITIMLEGED